MKIKQRQQGIALVEVLVAVVILAIGLLGTIGLQARAYSALNDATQRGEATIATEKLIGMMTVDQANLADYALAADEDPGDRLAGWYAETQAAIPGSWSRVEVTPVDGTERTEVVISIGWQRKGSDNFTNTHRVVTYISQSK